jgi:hypothetical protein
VRPKNNTNICFSFHKHCRPTHSEKHKSSKTATPTPHNNIFEQKPPSPAPPPIKKFGIEKKLMKRMTAEQGSKT